MHESNLICVLYSVYIKIYDQGYQSCIIVYRTDLPTFFFLWWEIQTIWSWLLSISILSLNVSNSLSLDIVIHLSLSLSLCTWVDLSLSLIHILFKISLLIVCNILTYISLKVTHDIRKTLNGIRHLSDTCRRFGTVLKYHIFIVHQALRILSVTQSSWSFSVSSKYNSLRS